MRQPRERPLRLVGPIEFSPDGKVILLTTSHSLGRRSHAFQLHTLATTTWSRLGEPSEESWGGVSIEWNSRGDSLIATLGGDLWQWTVEDAEWTPLKNTGPLYVNQVKWAPDGKSILAHYGDSLHWLDVAGRELPFPTQMTQPRTIPPDGFDWSPDGRAIWIADGQAGQRCPPTSRMQSTQDIHHRIRRVPLDGKPPTDLAQVCGVRRLSVSQDGEFLAAVHGGFRTECVAGPSSVAVFDANSGRRVDLGESAAMMSAHWHPTQAKLLYISAHEPRGPTIFDAKAQQTVCLPLYQNMKVSSPVFHPKSERVWALHADVVLELVDQKWTPRCRWDGKGFVAVR